MAGKKNYGQIFTKGLIKENPVLRLVLGTCPTLAVTTAAINGIGMGIAATVVLVGSNLVISLLRKVIPDRVRIPAYITIIAGFVTIVQMLVKAFAPAIDAALGIYLPLIVVNCIILPGPRCSPLKTPCCPLSWTAWAWAPALRPRWWSWGPSGSLSAPAPSSPCR